MGEPAIRGASAAQACAWGDEVPDTVVVSSEALVSKKFCACMMESFLSKSGHDKAAVVEVATN